MRNSARQYINTLMNRFRNVKETCGLTKFLLFLKILPTQYPKNKENDTRKFRCYIYKLVFIGLLKTQMKIYDGVYQSEHLFLEIIVNGFIYFHLKTLS